MVVVGVPVRGGVTVGRTVTAADVAASNTEAKVDPASADPEAVLIARAGGGDIGDGVEVRAGTGHAVLLLGGTGAQLISPQQPL